MTLVIHFHRVGDEYGCFSDLTGNYSYWGDGSGMTMLGRILVEVREEPRGTNL